MKQPISLRRSRGAALVVALVMLVVVTLVGVTAARLALSDERSARSSRDHDLALQAAEAALRDAMADIDTGLRATLFNTSAGFESNCPNTTLPANAAAAATNYRGMCIPSSPTASRQLWQDVNLGQRGVPYGTFTSKTWDTSQVPAPAYIVETLPFNAAGSEVTGAGRLPEQLAYRITAVGFGPGGAIEVALQSFYVKIP